MTESFEWKPEYNDVLERIAATDQVENSEWPRIRDIVKSKLSQNITHYLENPNPDETSLVQTASLGLAKATLTGGLKIPPFPPRAHLPGNPNEAPKHTLTPEEAKEFKEALFKLIDDFEGPPFTIQRVCELSITPRKHYKYLGKYLRAVEKALLVTSTADAFPIISSTNKPTAISAPSIISTAISTPSTPLFSPIPFLHGDARRSQSRSPPPSPLALSAIGAGGSMTTSPHAGAEGAEQKAIGLVDELDDPSPGHLSDRPQAISATTTTTLDTAKQYKSLQDRFTKSEEGEAGEATVVEGGGDVTAGGETREANGDGMVVDEEGSEDKENKAS
ncbi:PPP4R2-domain-containing protein [Cristinia sonorae]|uniref:PPP4R2-domain-containing protein n=1 Tax=Cristinia sonorae TaxID=1940300 RepID=A0A8K0V0H8_9AGAR|nr:PPP4R2-domain-containing protein [Cristinia sonorae]